MKILAISTSGPIPSAAILWEDRLFLKQDPPGRTHSETLLPLIDALLEETGLRLSDMDLFAADTGPGSFTGVRIGVSAANAFGFSCQKPVMGISALEALAYGKGEQVQLCSILDARNNNAYAALYGPKRMEPSAVEIPAFFLEVPAGTLFSGDVAVFEKEIRSHVKSPAFSEDADNLLLADAVAYCALERFKMGDPGEKEVVPLYLRPSQAERLFEARNK